jgi:tetratricopeptide (TPR) repeat protein
MRMVLVCGWLLAPTIAPPTSASAAPASAPPLTPWAQAGARPFKPCHDAERQAAALRRSGGAGRGSAPAASEELLWSRRARKCPHAPLTLGEAAQQEVVAAATLLRGVEGWGADDPAQLDVVATEHGQRLGRALRWLDAAIEESDRRGERAPREAHYYRAYALTGLGRIHQARAALLDVVATGDIESWRADRMAALVEVMAGDLQRALGLAEQAVRATDGAGPSNDALISRYIRALVLDRAGAPASARGELRALRKAAGSLEARDAVESVLPIHERVLLRAIDASANEEDSSAVRLWEVYLSRPEPLAPERVLAERHRAELSLPPPVVRPP